jgi:hypothetical protein
MTTFENFYTQQTTTAEFLKKIVRHTEYGDCLAYTFFRNNCGGTSIIVRLTPKFPLFLGRLTPVRELVEGGHFKELDDNMYIDQGELVFTCEDNSHPIALINFYDEKPALMVSSFALNRAPSMAKAA